MRFLPVIIVLFLCSMALNAKAQEQQEFSSSMPEQWQLTLDVIKSKAQDLVVENNGLQGEYRQLIDQAQKLQQSIDEQQYQNEKMSGILRERHGITDQQLRIDELTQIVRTKERQARVFDEQWGNLQKKKSDMDRNIQQLKYTISDIELHQQAAEVKVPVVQNTPQPKVDDQLTGWRKQLEDQNRQEVLLENELAALKTGGNAQGVNADAVNEDNKKLEARLDILRLQKLQYEKRSSDTVLMQANQRLYEHLKSRKDQLEVSINAYEMRLGQLRESSLVALSWPLKRKKLVHEMVLVDARNNRMKDSIKVLSEDIGVLKDQVSNLERRIDSIQGKKL